MKIIYAEMNYADNTLTLRFDTREAVSKAFSLISAEETRETKEEFDRRLLAKIRGGYIIDAIKMHREATGSYLVDAKKYVDQLRAANGL